MMSHLAEKFSCSKTVLKGSYFKPLISYQQGSHYKNVPRVHSQENAEPHFKQEL